VYTLEILLRICLTGAWSYLCGAQSSWNYFDIFLVLAGFVDILLTEIVQEESEAAATQLLRACRLVRLTRMFRVFRFKFIKELQLMIKGLVGGLRTLCLAFALLFVVIYVIGVFATIAIGRGSEKALIRALFGNVPQSMFTTFRCFSGDCVADDGSPIAALLSNEFGPFFVFSYVACYMLITMGIFNVILAVYVDITMKAARENELTGEHLERESIRIARLTRELVKRFTRAHRQQKTVDFSEELSPGRGTSSPGMVEEEDDQIEISKELFLTMVQDRQVQRLMDDLDLPRDRANLFEALDADGSGTLHVAELVQGLLKVRGDLKKTDTVATLLATKAVFRMLEHLSDELMHLRNDTAQIMGKEETCGKKRQLFDFSTPSS